MTPSGCPVTPGFPIRTSPDHCAFDHSPELFAAYHVLLRLSTPRHPPCTLSSLTTLMRSWPLKNPRRRSFGFFPMSIPRGQANSFDSPQFGSSAPTQLAAAPKRPTTLELRSIARRTTCARAPPRQPGRPPSGARASAYSLVKEHPADSDRLPASVPKAGNFRPPAGEGHHRFA